MESQQPATVISDKELALKKMGLTLKKEKVTNINLSDEETRKQLWDKWKTKHPESTITWKTKKANDTRTLRCYVPMIIKEVSTTITAATEPTNQARREDQGPPAPLERSDNIHSDISDIETQISPSEAENIREEIEDENIIEELQGAFLLNPLLNCPTPRDGENQRNTTENRTIEISNLYINEEFQAEWYKANLTATTIPIEPFRVKAPSETNKYEVTNFYEFIPERMLMIKQEEEEFLETQRNEFPSLRMEDIKIKWYTFLCHEEMEAQGDIDEHLFFSHRFNIEDLVDEKRIIRNKKSNLKLAEAKNIKNLSENSLEKLMESWYESAVANRILASDNGRKKGKIVAEKSTTLVTAISKAIDPTLEETFKIKLRKNIDGNPNIDINFTCNWSVIEETIKGILGESPNIERLSQYIDKENWGDLTLQQALNQFEIFHEDKLNNNKSVFRSENG